MWTTGEVMKRVGKRGVCEGRRGVCEGRRGVCEGRRVLKEDQRGLFRLATWEQRDSPDKLSHDASHGPHVNSGRVSGPSYQHLRSTVPSMVEGLVGVSGWVRGGYK